MRPGDTSPIYLYIKGIYTVLSLYPQLVNIIGRYSVGGSLCPNLNSFQLIQNRLLDSLVVECWHRVREVPGSIPSQGPRPR